MSVEVARRFAKALDAEDYQTARAFLSAECEYTCRGSIFQGPDAIIASYQGTGDGAKRNFDSIHYESAVTGLSATTSLIHFTDHLCHRNERLTFKCQQQVEVNTDNLIIRIEHIDLAGQREALAEYMKKVGLE